jgi:hypothetical protein
MDLSIASVSLFNGLQRIAFPNAMLHRTGPSAITPRRSSHGCQQFRPHSVIPQDSSRAVL